MHLTEQVIGVVIIDNWGLTTTWYLGFKKDG